MQQRCWCCRRWHLSLHIARLSWCSPAIIGAACQSESAAPKAVRYNQVDHRICSCRMYAGVTLQPHISHFAKSGGQGWVGRGSGVWFIKRQTGGDLLYMSLSCSSIDSWRSYILLGQ